MQRYSVGLVGARGYVGREMLQLLSADPRFDITLATSREYQGQSVSSVFADADTEAVFSAAGPDEVARAGCDIIVLGLPNGHAAPYVAAIDAAAPSTLIIDLSADYRHVPGWAFGLSDLRAAEVVGAKRIANPGCYATAALLALVPIRDLLDGPPGVVGISGYSGAGTTPSPKNDPRRLAGNILPYGFAGHGHQGEVGLALGRPVRFLPHVAEFFRGLITTVTVPLRSGATEAMVIQRYEAAFGRNPTVRVQSEPPELRDVVDTPNAIIGGAAIDPTTNMLGVSCVHDNLLKGAASQAMANIRLALELDAPSGG